MRRRGAAIFFVDEAHFRTDAELAGLWVLKGTPALVSSTSPRRAEKAACYSGVCLETGAVAVMPITTTSWAQTSVAFLPQLRAACPAPLIVIRDNGPAHRGEALRTCLRTPELNLRLVALPVSSPDYNADEAIWTWARAEVTANTCWGTTASLQTALTPFFDGLTTRADEGRQRCRTRLPADLAILREVLLEESEHGHLTCALV